MHTTNLISLVPSDVVMACQRMQSAGYQTFLVGGAVRDLLLGRSVKDFDLTTAAHPNDVMRVFGDSRVIPTGIKHGTVTVLMGEARRPVEITTFRGDGIYSDGRHPDHVEFVSSLTEDLQRRDFTLNAMALDLTTGVLNDPFGGVPDLQAKRLRAVGRAQDRFREDGLRIMRAVRFAAQLEFTLDPETEMAMGEALDTLRKVSVERIRDELFKSLGANCPSIALRLMEKLGVLDIALPEMRPMVGLAQNHYHAFDAWEHTMHAVDGTPQNGHNPLLVRLATLLHDVGKPNTAAPKEGHPGENTFYQHEHVGAEMADAICRRLKLSTDERERITLLVKHHMFGYTPKWSNATVRRFISRVGADLLPDLFALHVGDVYGHGRGEDPYQEINDLQMRVACEMASHCAVKTTDLAIDGNRVMEVLGISPGRRVGEALGTLMDRVLEDPSLNTPESLETLLKLLPDTSCQ